LQLDRRGGLTSSQLATCDANDVAALRRQVRDLAALLALPALWRTAEPGEILSSLPEAVAGLLRADVVYVRFVAPADGIQIEELRPRSRDAELRVCLSVSAAKELPSRLGERPVHWARAAVNLQGRELTIVAGAAREDFPTRDEGFLLQVAADQAALSAEKALLIAAERRARAEAEVANQAKGAFLASMSHELRTPLNAIGGYVQLMELGLRGPLTREQAEDLARIKRSSTHLLSLINDVLNFAKIEAGRLEFDVVDIPLHALLEAVGELILPQLHARELQYEYRPPAPGVIVRADSERLRQVLLNLLSNAIKFTEPGGCISVAVETSTDEARIRVRDTGCGIAADKVEQVFEPFVQVHRTLSDPTGGVGLGLAISRELTRAMGGRLTVESTVGEGSTFTVSLPLGHVTVPS
jgi:signal transduction histidine kinase